MKSVINFINSINRYYRHSASRQVADPLLADIYRIKESLAASYVSSANRRAVAGPVEVITEYHRLIDLSG